MVNLEDLNENFDGINKVINDILRDDNYKTSDCQEFKSAIRDFQEIVNFAKGSKDRTKYAVAFIGAVKAGKSTLLNALCGYQVCEAGASAETTKNCTVIMNTNLDPKVVLYTYADRGNLKKEEDNLKKTITALFNNIFRGDQIQNDDIRKYFHKEDKPLNPNTLIEINSMTNLALAVVYLKVGEDSILVNKENGYSIAVIDLPGLDGLKAGIENNPVLGYICEETNHIILVQSSIGAFNKTTVKTLNDIKNNFNDVKQYNVFNYFDSMSWHTEDSLKHNKEEAEKNHQKELTYLNINGYNFYTVNAKMAWETIDSSNVKNNWLPEYIENPKCLREKSQINLLSKDLYKISVDEITESNQKATSAKIKKLPECFNENESHINNIGRYKSKLTKELEKIDTNIADVKKYLRELEEELNGLEIVSLDKKIEEEFITQKNTSFQNFTARLGNLVTEDSTYRTSAYNKVLRTLQAEIRNNKYNLLLQKIDTAFKDYLTNEIKNQITNFSNKIKNMVEIKIPEYYCEVGFDLEDYSVMPVDWIKELEIFWSGRIFGFKSKELKNTIIETVKNNFYNNLSWNSCMSTKLKNAVITEINSWCQNFKNQINSSIIQRLDKQRDIIMCMLDDIKNLEALTHDLLKKFY